MDISEFVTTTANDLTKYMDSLKINDMGLGIDTSKGKKLRGSLVVLVSNCLSGDRIKAMEFASAVELIHLGSLAHDDVIDEHQTRRGSIPLNLLKGTKFAILTGDRCFSLANKIASKSGNKESIEVSEAMEAVLSGAIKEISVAEFARDMFSGQIADKFYLKMIQLKTAGLFKSAGRFGAMAATEKSSIVELFGNYGESIGMAYQMADDLTDIIKMSNGETEPDVGSILSIVPAVLHYNKDKIKRAPFAMIAGRINIEEILEIVTSMDMSDKIKADIQENIDQAVKIIEDFEIQNEYSELLKELPGYCVNQILSEVSEKL